MALSLISGRDFEDERGPICCYEKVKPREGADLVVHCACGTTPDVDALSTDDSAYAFYWRPATDFEREQWKPTMSG